MFIAPPTPNNELKSPPPDQVCDQVILISWWQSLYPERGRAARSSSSSLSCRVFRSRAAEKDGQQTEHYEKRHVPIKLRDAAKQKLRESEKKFSPGCSSVWRHTPENQKQPAVMATCAADVVV